MQQRNTGRFGVKTSQTLKYNSNLGDAKSVTPVYFRWVDVDKDDEESSSRKYDHAIPQSINKQRRWETFDEEIKMEEKQEDQRSNTKEKEERMEKNQELKKQENKKKNQKSKHVKRLEQKEMAKLKKKLGIDDEMEEEKAQALIKEALEKQATSATQNDNGEEQDEEEQKEKIVINREPPKYLSWKSLAPEKNVVSAYIPKDRDQLYKVNQLRGRNKDYDQSNVKSRTEKKSDFQKSIFL
ncbi:hypothetical protein C9374_000424 [Naegleria lovaniensis]|uniref:Uncharacterized protein n=1 Tax=Naegleria lovaniensis TaxID=51637 RepID=A0AA88KBT0_NAELO|nr:uncharacterized protein C9374_013220 [Naegleria lovaniensis]XP_044552252.1 uncharacterized protein C9374_000424 [Naegleria lovaniensis]KAG2372768.1 hypothetical protein C9374_013220 [Naegleria lovaniensis]KAG2388260.1 hypothetical protein C9374_000424 [Naegleria lovaniensis]